MKYTRAPQMGVGRFKRAQGLPPYTSTDITHLLLYSGARGIYPPHFPPSAPVCGNQSSICRLVPRCFRSEYILLFIYRCSLCSHHCRPLYNSLVPAYPPPPCRTNVSTLSMSSSLNPIHPTGHASLL
ncbi:hypothetical protein EJ06DRAFT_41671 [Trichodelitschia bisporula]|uniref:Uncharacterized protein n=1 Tax=Trichodelitschia bisporula TaxID=703511 RepID=A0A6G1HV96_9PEZI|nr:hypothetical protein EJ06DRAFT_41671 [Trichodelitschia bisporula]